MEKMKIFVSWSGPRSAAVAEALKEYLPHVNNAFDMWLSSDDIAKGSRSTLEIAKALVDAKAGIICLTPNNLNAPWILFEAGGIAKTVNESLTCPLLIGLEPSDVSGPLSQFQHTTKLDEKELLKLVHDLNNAAGESARKDSDVDKAFRLCWPELKQKLDNLPADGPTQRPERKPEVMLEELLDLARKTSTQVTELIFAQEAAEANRLVGERIQGQVLDGTLRRDATAHLGSLAPLDALLGKPTVHVDAFRGRGKPEKK
jgi:hypothetical protein